MRKITNDLEKGKKPDHAAILSIESRLQVLDLLETSNLIEELGVGLKLFNNSFKKGSF